MDFAICCARKYINEFKQSVETLIQEKTQSLEKKSDLSATTSENFDATLPGREEFSGSIHPVTHIMDEIISVFFSLGFSIEEGQEVETDFYNFEAVNIQKDHPYIYSPYEEF